MTAVATPVSYKERYEEDERILSAILQHAIANNLQEVRDLIENHHDTCSCMGCALMRQADSALETAISRRMKRHHPVSQSDSPSN